MDEKLESLTNVSLGRNTTGWAKKAGPQTRDHNSVES